MGAAVAADIAVAFFSSRDREVPRIVAAMSQDDRYTIRRLTDSEDGAAKHGLSAMGEARLPNQNLNRTIAGIALPR